jgi:hypothetical protein
MYLLVTGSEISMSTSVTAALVSGGAALVMAMLGIGGATAARPIRGRLQVRRTAAQHLRQIRTPGQGVRWCGGCGAHRHEEP